MQGHFKIPVKNGYIDIDKVKDTHVILLYDNNMEFAYVLLDYETLNPEWEPISEDEFDSHFPEPEPEPVVPEPYQPTITDAIQLMNDIKVDLLIAGVIQDV